MKKLLALLLVVTSFSAFAQESLEPLRFNGALQRASVQEKVGALHGTYIYSFDTLQLPFVDDFSQDHFEAFDAQPGDANVSDTTWFHIEIGGVPEPMDAIYMTDTTYKYEIDTVPGFGTDSFTVDTIPLNSLLVDLYDLSGYLVTSQTNVEVWPAMVIFDTLYQTSTAEDTLVEVNPDLEQDSMTIYFVEAFDNSVYWMDRFAYRNSNFPVNPKSIGVATFDGLDENGYPYDWSSAAAYGVADYLTSKPLALDSYQASDQIALTFLYEPGGLGEDPESQDSLVVEFWAPDSSEWYWAWSTTGFSDTDYSRTLIPIDHDRYLKDGFQFRFKNYGSLTGSLDHWHVDYVKVAIFNTDTIPNDLAYAYPVNTLLKDYTAMPWPHFLHDTVAPLLDTVFPVGFNNHTINKPMARSILDIFHKGVFVDQVEAQNDPNNTFDVFSDQYGQIDYWIEDEAHFNTAVGDTCVTFDCRFKFESPDGSDLRENDTLWMQQKFENYYSYDDGSAEAAYGIQGAGAELAYQFTLPAGLSDTIRAVYMHFSASVNDMSQEPFFIQIWDDNGGVPGNIIYTTDDQNLPVSYVPQYNIGVDGFYEYVLPEQIELTGTFYVGWKQSTPDRMNIGFDKNINHQDKIFYDIGTGFTNTGFEGSLMIRPVFVSEKDALSIGIDETPEPLSFKLYPNPASQLINIEVDESFYGDVSIIDLQGKVVYNDQFMPGQSISIADLASGLYLVQIKSEEGVQSIQKLSVRH